jgi:Caenorhabditis protein of unknown function, DUF268
LCTAIKDWSRYARDRRAFLTLDSPKVLPWGKELPILGEWRESSGDLGAYFYQDQMLARWIHQARPERHVDVGSRLDGFVGMLSVFREVEVIDIRPSPYQVQNICFHQMDLMQPLSTEWIESTDSLSCLHTIEHFGLGRYGDTLDPVGHLKGLEQLKRMVKIGGRIYLSTPLGMSRVEYNAHRVFSASEILGWFQNGWEIERLAVIDDSNHVHEGVDFTGAEVDSSFDCHLGVGVVVARKISA